MCEKTREEEREHGMLPPKITLNCGVHWSKAIGDTREERINIKRRNNVNKEKKRTKCEPLI